MGDCWNDAPCSSGLRISGSAWGVHLSVRLLVERRRASPASAPEQQPQDGRTPKERGRRVRSTGNRDGSLQSLELKLASADLIRRLAEAGEPRAVDDAFLDGWLRLADGDAEKAVAMLRSHTEWRKEMAPSGHVLASQIPSQLKAGKAFQQGCDTRGRPLVVVLGRRHFGGGYTEFLRLLVFCIDAALRSIDRQRNPRGLLSAIVDLSGIGIRNLDAPTMKAMFDVIAYHYPGTLHRLWFVDAPLIFNGLWRVVKPVVHASIRDKVVFVRRRQGVCVELLRDLGAPVLPQIFGGGASLRPAGADGKAETTSPALLRRVQSDAQPMRPEAGSTDSPNRGPRWLGVAPTGVAALSLVLFALCWWLWSLWKGEPQLAPRLEQ